MTNPNGHDELLTIPEVADMLRVPVATVRWWRHSKKGPRSFKLGRRVVYQESDLRAWIREQREAETPSVV